MVSSVTNGYAANPYAATTTTGAAANTATNANGQSTTTSGATANASSVNVTLSAEAQAALAAQTDSRTTDQVVTAARSALDKLLADLGTALDIVMELVVDDDEVIRRLSGRRTCRGCGKIWHVEFDPTSKPDICDRCGSELFQRDDDKAETIANRLVEYADKTAPLVDFYGAQGKLVGIDATGPVEDVTVRAIDALRSYGG